MDSSHHGTRKSVVREGYCSLRTLKAGDVDEHADNLSAWEQHYDQLSAGRFSGALTEFWTEETQVFLEKTSCAVRQSCRVWPDSLWFGIPVRHDGTRMGGREAPDGAVLVHSGGSEFELVTPADHEIFGIVVRQTALQQFCATQGIHSDLERLRTAGWIELDSAIRRNSVGMLQNLFVELARNPGAGTHQAAHRHLEDTVLELLLPFVESRDPAPEAGSAQARRRLVVAEIVDFARAHPDWVPGVPELCEKFHLSRRSLQYAFEEVMGTSPSGYLRALRLNGVRRSLRTQQSFSVQDAALGRGFWNLSQFSADYRKFFGERPSDTLNRANSLSPSAQYPRRH
ncbi:helix-turn-helix domain-containing protein [Niveibacterium terrae]|uniref:helix-turn-helix domain-containing protein n=1 Tax=Niveibacterium terrae TaxID=3373598 RepID=UPI003A8CB218